MLTTCSENRKVRVFKKTCNWFVETIEQQMTSDDPNSGLVYVKISIVNLNIFYSVKGQRHLAFPCYKGSPQWITVHTLIWQVFYTVCPS